MALVSPQVIRRRLSWVVVGGVLALGVAGVIDTLRLSGSSPSASEVGAAPTNEGRREFGASAAESSIPAAAGDVPLPRCTAQQIGASIEVLSGTATIIVRHVWGGPCHLPRLPVELTVKDRAGKPVRLVTDEGREFEAGIGGDFSPNFERLMSIPYLHRCHRGPVRAFLNVGPYTARRTLSGGEIGCFRGG